MATHYKLGNEKHADFEKQLAGLLQGLNDLLARLKDIETNAKGGAGAPGSTGAAASPSGADSKKLGMLAKKVSNLEALVSSLQEALKELKAA